MVKLPSINLRRNGGAPASDLPQGSGNAPAVPPQNGAEPIDPAELRELRAQRDRLREKFTIMQSDLGGAFYEMAIRDHVKMDVLTRKAAELQRVDAELVVFERILKLEGTDAAGLCSNCGSAYHHGQQFCAQCGHVVGQAQAPR